MKSPLHLGQQILDSLSKEWDLHIRNVDLKGGEGLRGVGVRSGIREDNKVGGELEAGQVDFPIVLSYGLTCVFLPRK